MQFSKLNHDLLLVFLTCYIGTVVRTSSVKLLERSKCYKCEKCGQVFSVETEFEQCYTIPKPSRYINFLILCVKILILCCLPYHVSKI